MPESPKIPAQRIVVVMPNWLGDAVMATPFLRALQNLYPTAHIAAIARPLVAPVLSTEENLTTEARSHGGWVNEVKRYNKGEEGTISKWMRTQNFDLGILLPNSFRSAWMLRRGHVKHRFGYARGGRGWLLTDRIRPIPRSDRQRQLDLAKAKAIQQLGGGSPAIGSPFEPIPTINYYLALSNYLMSAPGSAGGNAPLLRAMSLHVSPSEKNEAEHALTTLNITSSDKLAIIVPGANFGASKCWLPERFAELADRLAAPPWNFTLILAGSPNELPIVEAILAATKNTRTHALAKLNNGKGISIGALKEIVGRASLMVANDTGPRHFAAAFDIPLITLFGPTDPVWAETYAKNERIVRIEVPCGPCQLKKCPIDHRCMKGISVDMVMAAVSIALSSAGKVPPA